MLTSACCTGCDTRNCACSQRPGHRAGAPARGAGGGSPPPEVVVEAALGDAEAGGQGPDADGRAGAEARRGGLYPVLTSAVASHRRLRAGPSALSPARRAPAPGGRVLPPP